MSEKNGHVISSKGDHQWKIKSRLEPLDRRLAGKGGGTWPSKRVPDCLLHRWYLTALLTA